MFARLDAVMKETDEQSKVMQPGNMEKVETSTGAYLLPTQFSIVE